VATVIVLNGTSSSGKTTIARAFQDIAPRLFLNFSIDSILDTLPPRALKRIAESEDLADLRVPELVKAFYACAGTLLNLGHDLIIDHAITASYHADLLAEATRGHRVLLVGIDCPVDVLRQREAARGDRRRGLAEQQARTIHTRLTYDLFIDSSVTSPEDAAAQIAAALG
jgi:chloramphenicol 3-O phosphotransferase